MNKKILLIAVGAVLLLLVIIGVVLMTRGGSEPTTTDTPEGQGQVVEVPFDYTVSTIDQSNIVITGENGDLTLPNDPNIITVYMGDKTNAEPATIADLQIGQKIQLVMVPGQSASVYILP